MKQTTLIAVTVGISVIATISILLVWSEISLQIYEEEQFENARVNNIIVSLAQKAVNCEYNMHGIESPPRDVKKCKENIREQLRGEIGSDGLDRLISTSSEAKNAFCFKSMYGVYNCGN